ncbi:MAG TPA: ATP-dependent DNA helicase UvrD2 [Mycobacteriales bacterium]|nr:ATP-dependent DNA helicase UvrD2 [Mycobacteriales bacterium]
MLAGLDPDQRAAAAAPPGPVVVLAGAGTGKTRTITHRIAHLVASGAATGDQVLAVTFTTRAAGELRARLRALGVAGVQARTFHAAARRQLAYFWPQAIGGSMPNLVDSKLRLVAEAAARCRLSLQGAELRDVASEIEWARATLTTPEAYPQRAAQTHREPPRPADQIAALLRGYDDVKTRAGVIDFDDLLLLLTGILVEHRDVAAAVRGQYRHFVVDEYQDVTPLQQQLLDAWLGDRDSLTVVGDAQQTIYSFTGATPAYLLGMAERFPRSQVVRLTRDYRSTPQVVGCANAVIAKAAGVPAAARFALVAQRPDGPPPRCTGYDSEPEEARAAVAGVQALAATGVPYAEMAVLYRIHAQSETYEAAFAAAGVPVVLRGGDRFFERPEIREAMVLLRGAARAAEPPPGENLAAQTAEVLRAAGRDGWRADAPPPGGGAARERWDNIAALVALADGHQDLAGFVADLADRAETQHAPTVPGVTLATLHAAKGLEWDAVWLVGLADGTVPLVHAQTAAQIEEERRLLYVGVTRAREHLTLSWAAARHEGGRRSRQRSRFLDDLPGGTAPPRRPPARTKGRGAARCRGCGTPLATGAERVLGHCPNCPSDADDALFERLRNWRAATARGLGQPAFCVFTDATLTAIAERRPAGRGELAAIPGIGATKLARYATALEALIAGAEPEVVLAAATQDGRADADGTSSARDGN